MGLGRAYPVATWIRRRYRLQGLLSKNPTDVCYNVRIRWSNPGNLRTVDEYKCHLDFRDKEGLSAMDLPRWASLSILLSPYSLQCLAVKVILDSQIEYERALSEELKGFICLHKTWATFRSGFYFVSYTWNACSIGLNIQDFKIFLKYCSFYAFYMLHD